MLGLWDGDAELGTFRGNKGVFWTDNLLGNALDALLLGLEETGYLEGDDEGRVRWRTSDG